MKFKEKACPSIIRLETSNTCNLQCPHCRHHSEDKKNSDDYPEYYRNPKHMTKEEVDFIIDDVSDYNPSITLNLANEPLISPVFSHTVRKIKNSGLSSTFNTNGMKLNREISSLLVETSFDSVNISIDAMSSETLKKARGITNINMLDRNVKELLEIRGDNTYPRIGVTFVNTDYNQHELDSFIDYWKEYVDVIRVGAYMSDDNPDLKSEASINADIQEISGIGMEKLPNRIPCKQLFSELVIRANGDVTPCVVTSEKPNGPIFGNVFKDGGVLKVWNSEKFQRARELHNLGRWDEIDYCKGCDYWVETNNFSEVETSDFIIRSPSPYVAFYNVKSKMKNWNKEGLHERQGTEGLEIESILE
jgi:radical SAM protein with 4Fe4S-binding SPASM domain